MIGAGLETEPEAAAVRGVLAAMASGLKAGDAAAVARCYAPDARIADLAPPLLRRGADAAGIAAWLAGWDGPVAVEHRDLVVEVSDGLAVAHGLQLTRARTHAGEDAAWWSRATFVLARTPGGWRITHAHESVPFHMDGSFRAAVDLAP